MVLPHCWIRHVPIRLWFPYGVYSFVVFGNVDGFSMIIFDDVSITNYQFKMKWYPCESHGVFVFFRRINWRTPDYSVNGACGPVNFVQITRIWFYHKFNVEYIFFCIYIYKREVQPFLMILISVFFRRPNGYVM